MIPVMTHKRVMMSGAFPVSILALRYRGLTLRVCTRPPWGRWRRARDGTRLG